MTERCGDKNPTDEKVICELRPGHHGAHEYGSVGWGLWRWGTIEQRLHSIEADIVDILRRLEDHRL